MTMNNCAVCGKPVRLRATRISVDRRRGVAHYIDHMDGSPMHESGWEVAMVKPYPAKDADKPWCQMIAKWNENNPAQVSL